MSPDDWITCLIYGGPIVWLALLISRIDHATRPRRRRRPWCWPPD